MFMLSSRVGARALGALLLLLAGTPAAAQVDTGTILGTVKDQSGGVLPGATVTITHEGQGFALSTVTREDGTFILTPVRIQRGDAVRAKLAELDIGEADIAAAVDWARQQR